MRSRGALTAVCLAVVLIAGQASASALEAQEAVDSDGSSWSVGPSLGFPGLGTSAEPSLFVIGVQAAQLRRGRLGGDVSVGVIPRILFEGVFALGARGGLVLPIGISESAAVLPSAGLSFLGGFGRSGGGAEFGGNVGLGVLLSEPGETGVRMGATWHHFSDLSGVWLLEIGFAPQASGNQ